MKFIGRIITVIATFILIAFLGAMFYFNVYGKDFLTKSLTEAFGHPVEFESIVVKPPFVFHLINFNMGENIKANRVDIYPRFSSFFGSAFSINRLVLKEAVINFVEESFSAQDMFNPQTVLEPQVLLDEDAPKPQPIVPRKITDTSGTSILLQHLFFENSTVNYKGAGGLSFTLTNVELDAQNIMLPELDKDVFFKLTSILHAERKQLNNGRVIAEGWLNWNLRNMQATLKVQDKKQKDALTAILSSKDNELAVKGEIVIKDFGIQIKDEEGEDKSIQNLLSDVLSTVGIDVGAKFNFVTQMDNFEITNVVFSGSIVSH